MNDEGGESFRYFEDYIPGQIAETSTWTMMAADIIRFATEFDPQPMHIDPAAAQLITGGLIASGWHTASITMRLMLDARVERPAPGTLGLGFQDLRWLQPVRPGDVLHVRIEVLDVRLSETKPDRGIITSRFTTINQRDEPVQIMVSKAMVPRRR
jgi:acyl dehydratase